MDTKKVIVITGGSEGSGRAIAEELSSDNIVIVLARNEKDLKAVASSINYDYEVCDVSDYNSVQKAVDNIILEYGKIDCLINNAGIWIQDKLEDNDYEKIKEVIEVNTLGVIYMTKAVIPHMKKREEGIIININSQAGINYKAERTVYNSSKWGVTGFTKSIQPELAPYGIRVTDVMPGMMKTNMFSKMGIEKDMKNSLDTKELAKLIRFIISTDKYTIIPEVGIKHINN